MHSESVSDIALPQVTGGGPKAKPGRFPELPALGPGPLGCGAQHFTAQPSWLIQLIQLSRLSRLSIRCVQRQQSTMHHIRYTGQLGRHRFNFRVAVG